MRLKTSAQTCKFGDFLDNEVGESVGKYKLKILDEVLTDRFIVGLVNEQIKSKLLTEENKDFKQCCEKALLQLEMLQRESKSLQPMTILSIKKTGKNFYSNSREVKGRSENGKPVQSKRRESNDSGGRRCIREHNEKTCPANKWKCYTCGKIGQISPMWRAGSNNNSIVPADVKNIRYEERDSDNRINLMQEGASSSGQQFEELNVSVGPEDVNWVEGQLSEVPRFIRTVKRPRSSAFDYEVKIEGKKVIMECDCGAVVTVMSLIDFNNQFSHSLSKPNSNDPLRFVSGEKLIEVGSVNVTVEFLGKVVLVPLRIVDMSRPFMPLFGRNWLDKFITNWRKYSLALKRIIFNR